ncbi:DNA topoisomerase IV subunit A [Gracilinema caldarium]|uniref:DNA topoisomerase (ATP-hydrolyzing) n=1 Tax=Gracilinema caldarium (strain ATCC 51460 / DSM 7334 / H1) TaxID=744872 RepID=F8F0Q9_GRAC1|nr:DNA topoisomerase IV subunit A [Gracilinema caldarium]AEJ19766.1 DNA topoisomerase (ATP-hydrolyzing) [Gracilinema caldarium DSM 7334]
MAYIKTLFDRNFIEYASYVIKDRAIPDLEDGLKPVQRRILHSLFEMDDGKFHKVANVVGHCMKYHPHGDASIGSALVVLANKDLFIDKQGNFGNIFTGDEASAARYIECRATPLAKELLYNPKLTPMVDSYDGRNKEPVVFPAKIPVVLVLGAEGIAVGMSTKILPHNIVEVLEAEKACLAGKKFKLYPDFPTGGLMDVSDYRDGNGKVVVRAKLDVSDPKRIVIRELPYGSTTESLIASVEAAAKAGRIKIQSISDFTTEQVEIEIKLARGVYSEETVNALYAFTECEQSISVNLLVIKDGMPTIMTVTEVIEYHAKQLVSILTKELELERSELLDKVHLRTLERIFIEERIYKAIEEMKTAEAVQKAVIDGFKPFMKEIGKRGVSPEDVEHLLKIPIRRISLYDINKAKAELKEIKARIAEIEGHLKNITAYATAFLDGIIAKIKANEDLGKGKRKTQIESFNRIDVKEVVKKDLELHYDAETGYLGTQLATGTMIAEVSPFDRILVLRNNGTYSVIDLPEKVFVGEHAWWVGIADKEALSKTVFSIIYKEAETGYPYIKRCVIEGWIMNKEYNLVPEGAQVLHIDTRDKGSLVVTYVPKPRIKVTKETIKLQDYLVKGLKAGGVRIAAREAAGVEVK